MYEKIKSFAQITTSSLMATAMLTLALLLVSAVFTDSGVTHATRCIRQDFDSASAYQACVEQEAETREVVTPGASSTSSGSKTIDRLLQGAIDLMAAVTGIVIVLSIIIGAIQYMTARDNSGQVAAAKNRILMSILSLVLFIFAYTILQWLVPGGIF